MDATQVLTWILGAVGIFGFILAGQKIWWAWYVNIACQFLWVAYAIMSSQPAFLITAAFYFGVFLANAVKWTRERNKKPEEPVWGPAEMYAYDELERIGEDREVIDWYINVIREYHKFGHSGGSHMAIAPTLMKLLSFTPLSPITNDPSEWQRISPDHWIGEEAVWQNRRDGRAFSNDGGETYTLVDDRPNEYGKQPVYTTECNICWENRDKFPFTCPGCGAESGNFVHDH